MKLIRGHQHLKNSMQPCVATLGNFDGLHQGHLKMIDRLKTIANHHQQPSCVITFEPLPQHFFSSSSLPRLMTFRDKLVALESMGIDQVVCLKFDKKLANLSANMFIETILKTSLNVKGIVVGDDFRFGYQREGDILTLRKAGVHHGFEVHQVSAMYQNDRRISSTQIRQALARGDMALAKVLLGRDFYYSARVVHGDQLGRRIGFPTANLPIAPHFPLRGVYLARVTGLNEIKYAVTNVGKRPTRGGNRLLIEAHILNFEGDLYGKRLDITFLYKLRDEQAFPDLDRLKKQIVKDKILAETIMTGILS